MILCVAELARVWFFSTSPKSCDFGYCQFRVAGRTSDVIELLNEAGMRLELKITEETETHESHDLFSLQSETLSIGRFLTIMDVAADSLLFRQPHT